MKTLKLNILLLAAWVLMAASCQKEENRTTTVYGNVYTKGTTDFPSDTPIKMSIDVRGYRGTWPSIAEFYTDNNGYYSYTFTAEDFNTTYPDYRVRVAKGVPNHWPPFDYCYEHVISDISQNINLELAPHAYLQLHVRNKINPQVGDRLWINWGGGDNDIWYANFEDTVIRKAWGNSNISLSASFRRNEEFYDLDTTLYLLAFDTTYYLLDIDL